MLPKVFLAIPTMGWVRTTLMVRVIGWMQSWRTQLYLRPTDGERPAPYCRNMLVREFLASDCTHIWQVDHKVTPPANALGLLLNAKVAAISGIVNQMKSDDDDQMVPVPMVVRKDEAGEYKTAQPFSGEEGWWPEEGRVWTPEEAEAKNLALSTRVEQIDACGSACVLYTREVFEALEFPWYDDKPWGSIRGSDWLLAERMAEAGIKLHAHYGVICARRHEGDI